MTGIEYRDEDEVGYAVLIGKRLERTGAKWVGSDEITLLSIDWTESAVCDWWRCCC